ncbi:uncharacterized protein LOC119368748 [Triticum dicoccoides]|uniref:uncharacterized protein LOC119368748 n=1 Tax=Triticum dicoccoides TaxID=85692 RepID=UPI000E79B1B1|nr:uncharacterized protein LOC119368748 [Triticum dicoccoides]
MASSSSARSSRAATCLVLLLLVVSLREASAARPLRPAVDMPSEVPKDQVIVDKYAPLLLAMLPRGPVPPSAPSGGTNEAGN